MKSQPCIVGIDFGTTSLSTVVINLETKRIEKVISYNTKAYIAFEDSRKKEQSLNILSSLFYQLLAEISAIPNIQIRLYSFTGQMHGVIGLNKQHEAVSHLVTWQDQSGDIEFSDGETLLNRIKRISKTNNLANGYGIVSLYKWLCYDKRKDIVYFCTVPDYFARLLSNEINNNITPSMAHSIGLFDIHSNSWSMDAINKLGLSDLCFPEIVRESTVIGYVNNALGDIPVTCAMGDNQASFMGSVMDHNESFLLNIGTGSQLSFLITKAEIAIYQQYIDGHETQLRPFSGDHQEQLFLVATSFINGGSVYKALFDLFKDIGLSLFELQSVDEAVLWKNMEQLGRASLHQTNQLAVSPLLSGLRKDPLVKGNISNISTSNFRSGDLIVGFLKGLASYYQTGIFPQLKNKISYISGGGNGLKRNPLFVEIIENTFGYPLHLTTYNEEAAVGAAISGAMSIQLIKEDTEKQFLLSSLG